MTVRHDKPVHGPDRFIAVRKHDLLEALCAGDELSDADRDRFRRLCRMLTAIIHYQYFARLERLRHDYYYFRPDIEPPASIDGELLQRAYADLVLSLDEVLKEANFTELPHSEIADAHRRRTVLRVTVEVPLDEFREIRFYRRGRRLESSEIAGWFGLRRRKVELEVHRDVVVLVAVKPAHAIASPRKLRALERRKIRPGSVMLKYFRNMASGNLTALFPDVRVVMSNADKFILGIPAILGGIPILFNLYSTITVLLLVIGFYLGLTATVHDKDMKTALTALTGLLALGGFVVQQWARYQRQSYKYRVELAENLYYRGVANDAGLFDYLIGAAEEQQCREAWLAYYFLNVSSGSADVGELENRIKAWLHRKFGIVVDFNAAEALGRLDALGLISRQADRFVAEPLATALERLQRVWTELPVSPQDKAAE